MPKRPEAASRHRAHMKTTNEPGCRQRKGSRFAREPSPAKSEARKAHDRTTVSALRHHQLMEKENAVVLFAMRAISHSFLKNRASLRGEALMRNYFITAECNSDVNSS